MLTKNEVNALNLSPTKKDFVQIWNELLEVSGKLSERWDPTSTNESDPGIVILKALTGIADKLNYNIDKNILEAFMPTAAQEESMRKLCEMLGYSVKYYQSAQTDVVIKYHNSDPEQDEIDALKVGLSIPKFTVITNGDQDINYFTINEIPYQITSAAPSVRIPCMEGQIVKCESINEDNIITINQITDDNRFYLPETQVAENGFFIYNIYSNTVFGSELIDGAAWEKVDNLNTQVRGSRVFKFGYDSFEDRPYLEFPDDYTELFGEGIFIYYTRTNGAHGNIAPKTLTQLEFPNTDGWKTVASESFSVENTFAATTGANPETIKQAYRNYNKTIGTFETLVTCRDYMNKIYSMISDVTGKPLVSNVLVTDIRNDLNRAVTICSCDDAGIFYKETPIYTGDKTTLETKVTVKVPSQEVSVEIEALKPEYRNTGSGSSSGWYLPNSGFRFTSATQLLSSSTSGFDINKYGTVDINEDGYYTITQDVNGTDTTFVTKLSKLTETVEIQEQPLEDTVDVEVDTRKPLIDHFDLVLYPYKVYNQINSDFKDIQQVYENSFTYSNANLSDITLKINNSKNKTLAHVFKSPEAGHIVSINNYLRLNATISTNSKITSEEGMVIIDRIKAALANAFNLRELDFGEEIPFDTILEVMEKADSRIKVISLNTPDLYTTFTVLERPVGAAGNTNAGLVSKEYAVKSSWFNEKDAQDTGKFFRDENGDLMVSSDYFDTVTARTYYNDLAVRNILAGRVSLFNTLDTFKDDPAESAYRVFTDLGANYPIGFPVKSLTEDNPFVVYTIDDCIYTGRWYLDENGEPQMAFAKIEIPEDINQGLLSELDGNDITEIETTCDIALEDNKVTDVELVKGEVIKFRAPNFTTIKTYPAYVNYRLVLGAGTLAEAQPALSTDLFTILNANNSTSTPDEDKNWQKVLKYFKDKDNATKNNEYATSYVHTFPVSQVISAYNTEIPEITFKDQVGPVVLQLENVEEEDQKYTLEEYFRYCGCVKLKSRKAKLTWAPKDGETAPGGEGPTTLEIVVPDSFNCYITNMSDINALSEATDNAITGLIGRNDAKTKKSALPTECSWKITYEFECVPFVPGSLAEWETFIRTCAGHKASAVGAYKNVLPFIPQEEFGVILWRGYQDTGSVVGRYTTLDFNKMLSFGRGYFGLLPDSYLRGIYLVERFGAEASNVQIANDTEYELKSDEYLYIEYTPSSTSEDGTTQNLPAITEKLGPGTIIRPSGFEVGLVDSSTKEASSFKTVDFVTDTGKGVEQIQMYALGANEQIEVRDFARTVLDAKTFSNMPGVWIYKNFDCADLETSNESARSYTLKDGEYIFYTDKDKAELAFFTSGTQVMLSPRITIPKFEKIEISSIFDSGISSIPWEYIAFSGQSDKIIFQEYQYITLTGGDTLKELIVATPKQSLNSDWQSVESASYILSSTPDKTISLPTIDVYTPFEYDTSASGYNSNGWDVCCLLELNVSSTNAQMLRQTDKIRTGIALKAKAAGGADDDIILNIPNASFTDSSQELYFKTNLSCQTAGNSITIKDLLYNPKNLTGFEVKLFNKEAPAIVKTKPGTIIPSKSSNITNLLDWPGELIATKADSELWSSVSLEKLADRADVVVDTYCERALRISSYILPNTYGLICIYVKYANDTDSNTWLELDHHLASTDVEYFSPTTPPVIFNPVAGRMYLRPGMNCLKINKSGRIFIKTESSTKGQLLFDNIRLIKTETVEGLTSKGLNLAQLGYLDTSVQQDGSIANNTVSLDNENQELLQKIYTEKVLNTLSAEETKSQKSSAYTDAQAIESNLNILSTTLNKLKEELSTDRLSVLESTGILASYNSTATALARLYNLAQLLEKDEIKDRLKLEFGIADQINNTDYASLEKGLRDACAALKEELLSEVAKLSADELDTLLQSDSEKAILQSDDNALDSLKFTIVGSDTADNVYGKTQFNAAIDAIKAAINDAYIKRVIPDLETEIDYVFNTKLAELQESIEQTASSEQRAKLNDALAALVLAERENKNNSIARKAAQLAAMLDAGNVNEQLISAIRAIDNNGDAVNLGESTAINHLLAAQDILRSTDILVLADELNTAIKDINTSNIDGIVGDLVAFTSIFDATGTDAEVDSHAGLMRTITNLCNGTTDITKTNLTSLQNNYNSYYNKTIKGYLDALSTLKTTLSTPETALNTAINNLKNSKDDQTSKIATKLGILVTTRNEQITAKNFSNVTDFTKLKTLTPVVDAIRNYFVVRVTSIIDAFETLSLARVSKISTTFDVITRLNTVLPFTTDADVQGIQTQRNAYIESYAQLMSDTLTIQNTIKTLPKFNSYPAFNAIANSTDANLRVLKNIAADINTYDVDTTAILDSFIKKVACYNQLEVELTNSIQRNESLMLMLIKAACPDTAKELFKNDTAIFKDTFFKDFFIELFSAGNLTAFVAELTTPTSFTSGFVTRSADVIKYFNNKAFANAGAALVGGKIDNETIEGLLEIPADKAFGMCESSLLNKEAFVILFKYIFEISKLIIIKLVRAEQLNTLSKASDFTALLTKARSLLAFVDSVISGFQSIIRGSNYDPTATDAWFENFDETLVLGSIEVGFADIKTALYLYYTELSNLASLLGGSTSIEPTQLEAFNAMCKTLLLETRLLENIRKFDEENDFYYNLKVEDSLAIEFNENTEDNNTLMNPRFFYDVNNVNNSFVVSKLDIKYLDSGLQIARSSRLN